MSEELINLIKLYNQFKQAVPLQFPNDHDFGHFIAWLERNYWSKS
jgi:hypothetical protein